MARSLSSFRTLIGPTKTLKARKNSTNGLRRLNFQEAVSPFERFLVALYELGRCRQQFFLTIALPLPRCTPRRDPVHASRWDRQPGAGIHGTANVELPAESRMMVADVPDTRGRSRCRRRFERSARTTPRDGRCPWCTRSVPHQAEGFFPVWSL